MNSANGRRFGTQNSHDRRLGTQNSHGRCLDTQNSRSRHLDTQNSPTCQLLPPLPPDAPTIPSRSDLSHRARRPSTSWNSAAARPRSSDAIDTSRAMPSARCRAAAASTSRSACCLSARASSASSSWRARRSSDDAASDERSTHDDSSAVRSLICARKRRGAARPILQLLGLQLLTVIVHRALNRNLVASGCARSGRSCMHAVHAPGLPDSLSLPSLPAFALHITPLPQSKFT
eukprot:363873-Chlamydomonas_euryale.AAC.2